MGEQYSDIFDVGVSIFTKGKPRSGHPSSTHVPSQHRRYLEDIARCLSLVSEQDPDCDSSSPWPPLAFHPGSSVPSWAPRPTLRRLSAQGGAGHPTRKWRPPSGACSPANGFKTHTCRHYTPPHLPEVVLALDPATDDEVVLGDVSRCPVEVGRGRGFQVVATHHIRSHPHHSSPGCTSSSIYILVCRKR